VKSAALLLVLALGSACGGSEPGAQDDGKMESTIVIDETLKADLQALQGARIYFGHQSVGDDILEGLRAFAREAGVELSIAEERVGANEKPLAKFEDFARHAESPASQGEQLLLVKLCFVDFNPKTDVGALVQAYAGSVERVRRARPEARLVHVTPPLCSRPTDMKSKLKRTLGSPVWEDQANARRAAFREALLARFSGEPFLDLGLVESTRPDGSRELHDVGGQQVPMLWPGYTTDGGHLNDTGKRVAARAFARAAADALR